MESKTLSLIQKIIVVVIALIAAFYYISIMNSTNEDTGSIDGMMRFTYIILVIALIGTVLVWLKDLIMHPKKLVQTLVFAAIFLIIILFAKYGLASNSPEHYANGISINATTSNWVDTGLYTFYILAVIAILLMILSPVFTLMGAGKSNNVAIDEISEGTEE